MKPRRVDFYDPLYDFVTFEEAGWQRARGLLDIGFARKGASTHGESISPFNEAKVILPFLSSVEFTRQGFLRQSNLAFLVYPSATHTRLAHSVGACYLGFLASQRVAVGVMTEPADLRGPVYLSKFLEDTGWREEFYLALLLHDVGHYPFSHALENNKDFWDAFGDEILHEDAACQLIQGNGPVYDATVRRVGDISSTVKKNRPHLAELFAKFSDIDKDAICYLISGDDSKWLAGKSLQQRAQLRVVHELVSGLLDLDRVDHYRRDNYFTGLRTGSSLNFPSLLSGLTIYYDPKKTARKPELRLAPSAIGNAISLLQTKERLTEDCFEHPINIAYEAMLHHAFNMYLYGDNFYESDGPKVVDKNLVYDLLVSTDDQLLCRMEQNGSKKTKDIVFRIVNRAPYWPAARLKIPLEHDCSLRDIRGLVCSLSAVRKTDIVIRVLRGFGARKLEFRAAEWLDLERLRHADGRRLVDGKYKRQINHFKQSQDAMPDSLWIYGTTPSYAERIGAVLPKVCKKIGCQQEDMW